MDSKTPEHSTESADKLKYQGQPVTVDDFNIAIHALEKYVDSNEIKSLLSALETLKAEPQNEAYQLQVVTAFNELGILQGAVLTYAPFLNIFISDDPFAD